MYFEFLIIILDLVVDVDFQLTDKFHLQNNIFTDVFLLTAKLSIGSVNRSLQFRSERMDYSAVEKASRMDSALK